MDKKEAILKSVLKLVNREGFYHLNMKKIAQEAGLAAGTIYLYFKGKEDLINELYKLIVHEFSAQVMHGYDRSKTLKDIFYDMLGNAIDYYVGDPDAFSFLEQYTYSPFLFKETQEENFLILQPIYQIMHEAKKQKLVKDLPEGMLVAMIYGPVTMMMKLFLAHKIDLERKSTRQKLIQACWEAISLDNTTIHTPKTGSDRRTKANNKKLKTV